MNLNIKIQIMDYHLNFTFKIEKEADSKSGMRKKLDGRNQCFIKNRLLIAHGKFCVKISYFVIIFMRIYK